MVVPGCANMSQVVSPSAIARSNGNTFKLLCRKRKSKKASNFYLLQTLEDGCHFCFDISLRICSTCWLFVSNYSEFAIL